MTDVLVSYSPSFDELVLNEIQREHPQATPTGALAPGVMGISVAGGDFAAFAAPWAAHLPIYIHHLCPVDLHRELAGTPHDLDTLRTAFAEHIAPRLHANLPLSIQTRLLADDHGRRLPDAPGRIEGLPYTRRDVASVLRPVAEGQGVRLRRQAKQVLSVVVGEGLTAYMGLSLVGLNVSPWPGGRMPVHMELPSRAGKKLVEALAAFQPGWGPGMHALDLGAAPGGWTKVLRERGLRVTAVDRAEMDPALVADEGVHWERLHAEEFVTFNAGLFDVIVNDIIMDAQDSARLMVRYAPMLTPGGAVIMTLKLRSHNRRRVMDHSFRLLRKAYRVVQVRQLYYNRHEVTLYLRRTEVL
jgi:23S rRNA (cytidine2498-2'-O)-methyltransferase